jgi:LysM repeat protein
VISIQDNFWQLFGHCFFEPSMAPIGKRMLMRWRVLLLISLVLNGVLVVVWFATERRYDTLQQVALVSAEAAPLVKTNFVVRRQFFSWDEVESPDYPTYIANLREIGCPEQTIRDIIIADVNALYARRLATELVTPDQQWWRSEPDSNVVRIAAEKLRAMDDERVALLTRLLGTNWESGDLVSLPRPSRPGVALDGPVLGVLPADVKQTVEDISARSHDRLQAYLETQRQQGKNADSAELARFRQQTRNELAAVLTPPQLEEYLLRYSQNASDLRTQLGQLKYFNATPDEFRAIFRATDGLEEQLQLLSGSIDPNSVSQRQALQRQIDNATKLALGSDRYEQYTLLHDPAYRNAVATAQQAGTPEAASTIYQINLATAQQQATIRSNTNLSPEQLAIELKRIELEQLKASAQATGQEVPPEQPALPATEPSSTPAPPVKVHPYVVGVADTISSVAMRYGVSVEDLKAANPGLDYRHLKPGDSIQVPDSLGR